MYVPLPSLVDPLFIAFVDSSAHSCCLLVAFALIPSVTKLVAMLRELDPKDKVREVTSEHLVNKLYAMGVISKTSKLKPEGAEHMPLNLLVDFVSALSPSL